jgi:thioredoxin reductase (NADPH)
VEQLRQNEKIVIYPQTKVTGLVCKNKLCAIKVNSAHLGGNEVIETDGLFLAMGVLANSSLVAGQLPLHSDGRVVVKADTSTKFPGVFGAGDVESLLQQLTIACGRATMAALSAENFLQSRLLGA